MGRGVKGIDMDTTTRWRFVLRWREIVKLIRIRDPPLNTYTTVGEMGRGICLGS